MIGYVLYTEKDEPETIRTHDFTGIPFWDAENRTVTLATTKGHRKHALSDYIDFGIFPFGPEHQTTAPKIS